MATYISVINQYSTTPVTGLYWVNVWKYVLPMFIYKYCIYYVQACHSIFNLKVKNKRSQFIKLKVQTSEIKSYFSTIFHRNQIESEYCAKLFLEQKEIIQG